MPTKIGRVELKVNNAKLMAELERKAQDALVATGLAVINDVLEARIVPKASGIMESTLQPLDISDLERGIIRIGSYTPYARRHYFNAEGVNFHRQPWAGGQGNANAQDHWFDPWINGYRRQWVEATFKEYLELIK